MRDLVERAESINAQTVGKALPADQETGVVELEIEGVGTQEVEIVSTPGNLGGRLRWFVCPGCGRRAGKLYLPKAESIFLCGYATGSITGSRSCESSGERPMDRRIGLEPEKKQSDPKKMLEWMAALLRARREKR